MNNRHSLRFRLLAIYTLIVLLLVTVVAVVLTGSYRRELISMRENDLVDCAREIAQMYAEGEISILPGSSNETEPVLITTAKDFDATIQIANAETGNINYIIDRQTYEWVSYQDKVDTAILHALTVDGEEYDLRSNYYNERMKANVSTIAYALKFGTGDVKAILIIHSDLQSVAEAYSRIVSSLILPVVLVVTAGMVVILISTKSLISRVRAVMNGTEEIAKGHFNKRLEKRGNDEITELAEGFNYMAEQLENSDEMKKEFTSNVAHELRSPMTSIHGFVEGMLDGTIAPEEHQKYLSIVYSETNRLTKLIQDMLRLSRIESGRDVAKPEKTDINELLRRVVIRMMQKIENSGIEPEILLEEEPLFVMADADKIEQVAQNLIDNAVKFTPAGKKVCISTSAQGDKALVSIRDEGVGISPEELKHIWERFYTVDKARTSKVSGTGLGLPIVKKIIDQHGESIQVESKPGEGTAFTFTLKLFKK